MFLTARLALWLAGMRSQVEGTQYAQQVIVSAQTLLISHLLQFQRANIKNHSRQTITSHHTAMVILCEIWC